MTSNGASTLFPQFMYESILKIANDDKDFEYKVRSTAYPVIEETKMNIAQIKVSMDVFLMTIAYSQILSMIVGQLVDERVSRMKFF